MKNFIREACIISFLALFSSLATAKAIGREYIIQSDFIYLDTSIKASTSARIKINTNLHNDIAEIGGGYIIRESSPSIELLAGVRYTNLEKYLTPGRAINAGESLIDGFGGMRLIQEIGENSNWRLIGKADMGHGSSALSWNAMALLNWQYKKRVSVSAGYKWLAYDYQTGIDSNRSNYEGVYQGPIISMAFSW